MAENITLAPVTTFTNDSSAVATVNANYQLIANAFNNVLDRFGTPPNTMQAVLDMNSFNIINLPGPATVNSPVRLVDVINPSVALTVPPVGTSGSVVGLLNGNNTYSGISTFTGTVIVSNTITSSNNNSWTGLNTYGNTTATWPTTYSMPIGNLFPVTAIDPVGEVALYAAGRSSDWNTNTTTTNSIPFLILSVHDRVTTSPQPTGTWGAYWQFNKTATASALEQQGVEMSFQNMGASVTTDPYSAQPVSGITSLMTLDSGIGPLVGNPVTSALRIINNGNSFNSGILFGVNSMTSGALAIQMPINYGITWYTNLATPGITFTGGASLFARLPGVTYGNVYTWASGAGDVIGIIGAANTNSVTFGSTTASNISLQTNSIAALIIDTSQIVEFASANSFSTPASVATSLGSIGPVGSHTTVQTWLTVKDNSGTTRYIPCF